MISSQKYYEKFHFCRIRFYTYQLFKLLINTVLLFLYYKGAYQFQSFQSFLLKWQTLIFFVMLYSLTIKTELKSKKYDHCQGVVLGKLLESE